MQLSLLGREEPSFERTLRLERRELGEGAFVEYMPSFVHGHATLFEALEGGVAWEKTTQELYDREVVTPRLIATIDDAEHRWPLLHAIAGVLSGHCGVHFDRITCALYRNGDDSVAWHRDRNLRNRHSGYVATVSVGEQRTFLMRPRGGGARSLHFQLGWGDLLIMGGTCQRLWEHTVPKTRSALGPRISIMFRCSHAE